MKNFDYTKYEKKISFKDHPNFTPMLTPTEMLELGVFGGTYFNKPEWRSGINSEIFDGIDSSLYMTPDEEYDKNINLFNTKAGQDQKAWEMAGWIHQQDPRGWFQWYCRFFSGRRTFDDKRQINRWRKIFRHQAGLKTRLAKQGLELKDIWKVLPQYNRACQTLLHWAWLPHIEFSK